MLAVVTTIKHTWVRDLIKALLLQCLASTNCGTKMPKYYKGRATNDDVREERGGRRNGP